MAKKLKDWRRAYKPWTTFEEAFYPSPEDYRVTATDKVMQNNLYEVTLRYFQHPLFGDMCHLSVKRRDREIIHDWRDLQRIKSEILGPEVEAIELYPAESRLVDTANQYHLWAVLRGRWPLGYEERAVSEVQGTEIGDKARQRPFPPDAKPADLMTPEKLREGLDKLRAAAAESGRPDPGVANQGPANVGSKNGKA